MRRFPGRWHKLFSPDTEWLQLNTTVPPLEVDRSDGTVRLHERVLRAEPVQQVPLSRRYLLG